MRSLVTFIFLYPCESWTLTAELRRRLQAMEMRCSRKILRISYKDHVTNEEVHAKTQQAIGPHEDLLTVVKRRILQWYGHVSRSSDLSKRGRRQGRQRKRWEDSIREWTVVRSCLTFIRSGQNHLAGHSERGKKTRQTEEEVGRQHQGMERPEVRQVPEGSGEQGKVEETGWNIICDVPRG